jgi:hypothetical protein
VNWALSHFFSDLARSASWTWTDTVGRELSLTGKEYAGAQSRRCRDGIAPKGFPRSPSAIAPGYLILTTP